MKRLLLATFVAFIGSSCATVMMPNGQRGRVLFLQRGIVLQIVHTCSDHGRLYQVGGVVVDVLGPEPRDVPLVPALFGDDQISLTFQTLGPNNKVLRTFSQSFYVDHESTTAQSWIISDDSSGWSGRGYHSNCKY